MHEDILNALMDWNPWQRTEFPEELLGIARHYYLVTYLDIPEIKILEGARRVGKSTLLYQVVHHVYQRNKKILYINFEDEVLKKYTLSQIIKAYLIHGTVEYLFIDEIQNCPEWVQTIRTIYDRKEMKQIWISGSNSNLIKQEYATLLTGRNITIHISPLSFEEFLLFKGIKVKQSPSTQEQIAYQKLFVEYFEFGSFPAIANRPVLKKELLLSYFEDFVYKDIVARHNTNAAKTKDLGVYLSTNTSKCFSYRAIAAALNLHLNTIIDYFSYFKEAFLFDELYKFDYSLKKQFSNDKKIYCLDVGLASSVSFKFSEDKGRILENIVFSELKRRKHEIYFHKDTVECDFLIKEELKITKAIQVTVSLEDKATFERETKGLLDAMECYKHKIGLILTESEEDKLELTYNTHHYTIYILPIWKWLLGF